MISHIPAAPNPFPPELVIYNYDNTIFTFFKDFSTLLDRNHFADKYAVAFAPSLFTTEAEIDRVGDVLEQLAKNSEKSLQS